MRDAIVELFWRMHSLAKGVACVGVLNRLRYLIARQTPRVLDVQCFFEGQCTSVYMIFRIFDIHFSENLDALDQTLSLYRPCNLFCSHDN